MTVKTETPHAGGFIVSEPDINLSRRIVTIAAGAGALLAGTVLGKYSSGGKYDHLTPGASNGLQTADALLFGPVDATDADVEAVVVYRLASYNPNEVVWPAGISPENKAAAIAALDAKSLAAADSDPALATVGASRLQFDTVPAGGEEATDLGAVTVRIENAEGVLLTGATNVVTLAKATGPGTLTVTGGTTAAAVGGIATFPGISFNADGTYTLTASASGLDSDTSGDIVVTAAP